MEAQLRLNIVSLILGCATLLPLAIQPGIVAAQTTYQANSTNFVVFAPDARLAKKASQLAEQYRKELSLDWLGYEIETWRERCPIYIEIGPHAGGETSFAFIQNETGSGEPISWKMKIYGPLDRLLDAVLPHEITHTIFATHFGRPLPRWADEGACTTVEHESERAKNHQMLISFLTGKPSRGIPFNRMFTMKQYPHDILPLYAQGYSVARYLIGQKGRQHFVKYLERGMSLEQSNHDTKSWDQATREFFGYEDLSELQLSWQAWVRAGSPDQIPDAQIAFVTPPRSAKAGQIISQIDSHDAIAAASFVDPGSTYSIAGDQKTDNQPVVAQASSPNPISASVEREGMPPARLNTWYARQSRAKRAVELPTNPTLSKQPDPFEEFKPGSLKRIGKRPADKASQTIWR